MFHLAEFHYTLFPYYNYPPGFRRLIISASSLKTKNTGFIRVHYTVGIPGPLYSLRECKCSPGKTLVYTFAPTLLENILSVFSLQHVSDMEGVGIAQYKSKINCLQLHIASL